MSKVVEGAMDKTREEQLPKDKPTALEDTEYKDVEIDDWLFEFAQLFRTHIGIDPDAHIDLHELGMKLCTEALEETVTSEEAQNLFDKAIAKFQEIAALAFFNWGNVHMCAARKKIPLDESARKEVVDAQLQAAYNWGRGVGLAVVVVEDGEGAGKVTAGGEVGEGITILLAGGKEEVTKGLLLGS